MSKNEQKNFKICQKNKNTVKSDPTDKFYKLRTIWGRITDIWSSLTGFTALKWVKFDALLKMEVFNFTELSRQLNLLDRKSLSNTAEIHNLLENFPTFDRVSNSCNEQVFLSDNSGFFGITCTNLIRNTKLFFVFRIKD